MLLILATRVHDLAWMLIILLNGPCFVNGQRVCYLLTVKVVFIYLFIFICFQYHQAILYIGSVDIILAIFLSLQLIPKQHYLCFVLLLIK